MDGRNRLAPLQIDDPMLFEAMVQSIIDARSMEMMATGGFDVDSDTDKGRVEAVVGSTFCCHFGLGVADRFSDIFEQSAHLADHLANGHVFSDGNKRTAVRMSLSLLAMRGIYPEINDSGDSRHNDLYQWIQALVKNEMSVDDFACLLRKRSVL